MEIVENKDIVIEGVLLQLISLGVILFKIQEGKVKYLLVQRRDTLGFVEFMRGKYNLENIDYICELT